MQLHVPLFQISLRRKNKRVLQHRYEVTILAEKLVASNKHQRMKEMQALIGGRGGDSRTQ